MAASNSSETSTPTRRHGWKVRRPRARRSPSSAAVTPPSTRPAVAARLGADVTILYRRRRKDMPRPKRRSRRPNTRASRSNTSSPRSKIVGVDGKVTGITCRADEAGRFRQQRPETSRAHRGFGIHPARRCGHCRHRSGVGSVLRPQGQWRDSKQVGLLRSRPEGSKSQTTDTRNSTPEATPSPDPIRLSAPLPRVIRRPRTSTRPSGPTTVSRRMRFRPNRRKSTSPSSLTKRPRKRRRRRMPEADAALRH